MPELKRTTSDSPESALCISARVHDMITEMKLRPILRTVCYRYAFQFPDTSDISITLDTDLRSIREDGKVGSGWRRGDIRASGLPFSALGCDVVRYRSSILEIKGLHTKMILLGCCIPSLLYASGRFWYRRRSILKGDSSNIDDPIGSECSIDRGRCLAEQPLRRTARVPVRAQQLAVATNRRRNEISSILSKGLYVRG